MRRAAVRALSSEAVTAPRRAATQASYHWANLFTSHYASPQSLAVSHSLCRYNRQLSTAGTQQQHDTSSHSDDPSAFAEQHGDSSDSATTTSSTSDASSMFTSPPATPVSVTAVTSPLSRSSAAAAASHSSSAAPSPLRLLRVPDLDLGDAKLSKWLVQPATRFTADCVLCELDTDMAVIEYKADRPGWLAAHVVKEGEDVHVDQPIGLACESEEQMERVKSEWSDKVARKERARDQRGERPARSLSDNIAAMKE